MAQFEFEGGTWFWVVCRPLSSKMNGVAGLSDISSWGSAEEITLATALCEAGQTHLFEGWTAGSDEAEKHAFFSQVRGLCARHCVHARVSRHA